MVLRMTLLFFACLLARLLSAADWPCFGGDPGRAFFSADTELRPPLKVAWRFRVEGMTMSQPIVAENKVFLRVGHAPFTYALNIATGELVWKVRDINNALKMEDGEQDGLCHWAGKVYYQACLYGAAGKANGNYLICRNAATGAWVWGEKLPGIVIMHKYSPVVYNGVVYGSCGHPTTRAGTFFARNAETGALLWEYTVPGAPTTSWPVLDTAAGILYGSAHSKWWWNDTLNRGQTFAFDLARRDTLWTNRVNFLGDGGDGSALTFKRGRLYLTAISSNPSSFDGCMVLDAATGALLSRPAGGFQGSSTVAVADSYLVSGAYAQPVNLCALDGSLIASSVWSNERSLVARCSAPVLANGWVFRGTPGARSTEPARKNFRIQAVSVAALQGREAPQVWSWHALTGTCCTVTPANGRLIAVTADGLVTCFVNDR